MRINDFDTDKNVLVIAEIGNNHEGVFALAQEMIGRAAEAGVDAVKLQTFVPESYVSCSDPERLERLRKFELAKTDIEVLSKQASECGLIFFSTPFDIESAHFLNSFQPIFKIASGDNNFCPLIDVVASFEKPTLISTGLANLDLLDKIYRKWDQKADKLNLAFLHCVASYPVPNAQANLGAIATLKRRYPDITIGYSDHTLGIDAAIYAVAAGAKIIEKHFTIDKKYSDFRDHQLSAESSEMKTLVEKVRRLETLLGSGEKKPQPCEVSLETAMRRSIAVVRDIPKGTILRLDDLTWVRPGNGLPIGNEHLVIGKLLNRNLQRGEIIFPEMLSG